MRNQIVRTAAAGALSVVAVAAFVSPALATQAAPVRVDATTHTAVTGPSTDIEGTPAKWDPAKLTAPPVPSGACAPNVYSFLVDNKTKKSQTVRWKKILLLKPGEEAGFCIPGSKGSTLKFHLGGSKSVLTVTFS